MCFFLSDYVPRLTFTLPLTVVQAASQVAQLLRAAPEPSLVVLQALMDSNLPRLQLELYKEIKKVRRETPSHT